MVRENRIKTHAFNPGSLTSTAGGILDFYSDVPLNGKLLNIEWKAGNHTATGSLIVTQSGYTENTLLSWTSGTVVGDTALGGDVASNQQFTIRMPPRLITGASGINAYSADLCLYSKIHVIGSGMGNAKSGLGLWIHYV